MAVADIGSLVRSWFTLMSTMSVAAGFTEVSTKLAALRRLRLCAGRSRPHRRPGLWRWNAPLPVDGRYAISLGEGNTPLVPLPRVAHDVGVKQRTRPPRWWSLPATRASSSRARSPVISFQSTERVSQHPEPGSSAAMETTVTRRRPPRAASTGSRSAASAEARTVDHQRVWVAIASHRTAGRSGLTRQA